MIEYILVLLAIPLGVFLRKLTKQEEEIFLNWPYFPLMIPVLFLLTLYFAFKSYRIFFVLLFILVMIMSWAGSRQID
ncbi:hypothetical protein D6829_01905 [Candidatus Pacearchaeota archaeon]|nr:MAG: hypothetical protein D6829_01905 [Candidatus Pacearchaeota archaeon]